ncbi:MAG TPA: hypothetical protein ENK15_02915 [Thermopetrobacter sp.]|nr:hypothetical protein [Thermopetrobacter sp.]
MLRMCLVCYVMAGAVLAGVMLTAALVLRLDTQAMLWMVAAGALLGIPVAVYSAKQVEKAAGRKL